MNKVCWFCKTICYRKSSQCNLTYDSMSHVPVIEYDYEYQRLESQDCNYKSVIDCNQSPFPFVLLSSDISFIGQSCDISSEGSVNGVVSAYI